MSNKLQLDSGYKSGRRDQVLTNVSIDYRPFGFIADRMGTPLMVDDYTGFLGSYGDAHLKLINSRVYDRGTFHVVPTFKYDISKTYEIITHGLKDFITKRDRREIRKPFDVQKDVVMGLESLLKIEKEYLCASIFRNTSSYESGNVMTLSGNAQWSDYTNSDPISDIKTAKTKVWKESGVEANTLELELPTLEILRSHPKLANIYGMSGVMVQISEQQLKNALGISDIVVSKAQYVNAAGTRGGFWGTDVVLYHRAPSAMLHQTTFAYNLGLKGDAQGVYRNPVNDPPESEMILCYKNYNYLIQNKGAGYLFKNAVA